MSENNSGTNSVLAFLIGGAIGATLALLYAPESGEETRKRIREGVGKMKERTKEGYDAALHDLEERLEAIKVSVKDKRDEVKAAYDAGKNAYLKEKEKHSS